MRLRPVATLVLVLFASLQVALTAQHSTKPARTDAQIKQEIIRESLASYYGSCPCPYNTDRAGRSCGRRSAYSRPSGESPVCYESDVTPKMVADYRATRGEQIPAAKTKTRRIRPQGER